MKKILCYGDSNTWGYTPGTGVRYPEKVRWSGGLSEILTSCLIVEQGANNRTGFFESPDGLVQSGGEYLPLCIQNNRNIDIFILALGTNDAQKFYNLNAACVNSGLKKLTDMVKIFNPECQIIIVPPVKITENILNSGFSFMFNKKSIELIKETFPAYKKFAQENNYLYFDFNKIASPSEIDGLHFSAEAHRAIAENLAKFITEHCLEF